MKLNLDELQGNPKPGKSLHISIPKGLERPTDIGWTVCPKLSSGAGTIEARYANGVLSFRGELKHSYSSTGTFVALVKLPDHFPKPAVPIHAAGMGIATGSSFRLNAFRLDAGGTVFTCAGTGAFDTVYFDGLHFIY